MEPSRRRLDDLSLLVSAEYIQIPGLRLTALQVARLWDIDSATTDSLLSMLTDARILSKTNDAAYVRRRDASAAPSKTPRKVAPLVSIDPIRHWPAAGPLRRAV